MKIECVIDTQKFTSKPTGLETRLIVKRTPISKSNKYSIEEIQNKILDGYTIRPSNCGASEEDWLCQQMFMIDIDNEPLKTKGMSEIDCENLCEQYLINNHRTYDDIIKHCEEINLIPTFIYTSFSHTEEHHKMRLVYIFDKPIDEKKMAEKIQAALDAN